MTARSAPYTFGIEEEFFLVDARTGSLPSRLPARFIERCRRELGTHVGHEMLQSQIEVSSPVFTQTAEALPSLAGYRRGIAELAGESRLALVAAGTHPLSTWRGQTVTDTPRYAGLADDFQIVSRRNLVCGLHVHVAVPDGVDRVQLMNRLMGWLPLFLALSASSPFWNRRRTGLQSYRQSAYDEWPRTGIPDFFADEADHGRFVALLVETGAIADAGMLWWGLRPAHRYPTLELRIADSCTRVEDAIALASLFRCLLRAYVRDPSRGAARSSATRRIIDENRWRAKRYGIAAQFIDEGTRSTRSVAQHVRDACSIIDDDLQALDCTGLPRQLEALLARGNSASGQLAIYHRQRRAGISRADALHAVARWLIATTAPTADSAAEGGDQPHSTS